MALAGDFLIYFLFIKSNKLSMFKHKLSSVQLHIKITDNNHILTDHDSSNCGATLIANNWILSKAHKLFLVLFYNIQTINLESQKRLLIVSIDIKIPRFMFSTGSTLPNVATTCASITSSSYVIRIIVACPNKITAQQTTSL